MMRKNKLYIPIQELLCYFKAEDSHAELMHKMYYGSAIPYTPSHVTLTDWIRYWRKVHNNPDYIIGYKKRG